MIYQMEDQCMYSSAFVCVCVFICWALLQVGTRKTRNLADLAVPKMKVTPTHPKITPFSETHGFGDTPHFRKPPLGYRGPNSRETP